MLTCRFAFRSYFETAAKEGLSPEMAQLVRRVPTSLATTAGVC